jgi:hypothetical protein
VGVWKPNLGRERRLRTVEQWSPCRCWRRPSLRQRMAEAVISTVGLMRRLSMGEQPVRLMLCDIDFVHSTSRQSLLFPNQTRLCALALRSHW